MSDIERAIEKLRLQLTTGSAESRAANMAEAQLSFRINERHRGPDAKGVTVLSPQESRLSLGPPKPAVALTPEAKTLLECFADEVNMTVTQEALADKARLSVPTVRQNLTYLRKNGLIHRPFGERKGDTITDKGLALLGRN